MWPFILLRQLRTSFFHYFLYSTFFLSIHSLIPRTNFILKHDSLSQAHSLKGIFIIQSFALILSFIHYTLSFNIHTLLRLTHKQLDFSL